MKKISQFFKKLLKTICWILVILIILVSAIYLFAGQLIQRFAPDFISKITQTETQLGKVDLSLLSGHIELNDLAIGNPKGFKDKNVFQLGKISVDFTPKSLLTNKIIINDVTISGVQVSTELNAKGQTNVTELLNNIQKTTGSTQEKPAEETKKEKTPAQTSPSKTVVIKDLKIEDSSVRAGIAGQMMTIPLPNIQQKNIGEQKKQTLSQTIVGILNTLNTESAKATVKAAKEGVKNTIQQGKEAINNLKDNFKKLF